MGGLDLGVVQYTVPAQMPQCVRCGGEGRLTGGFFSNGNTTEDERYGVLESLRD